ncbi:hypothetical protein BaRGS_00017831 [Batillaria attramentaria]|uniref:Novel STAND NTPase 3 domain-containing protein n=1 Tax=Batillaria attramentaria TaxID=370345 RepID=A0ABD0KVP4_9CAEN
MLLMPSSTSGPAKLTSTDSSSLTDTSVPVSNSQSVTDSGAPSVADSGSNSVTDMPYRQRSLDQEEITTVEAMAISGNDDDVTTTSTDRQFSADYDSVTGSLRSEQGHTASFASLDRSYDSASNMSAASDRDRGTMTHVYGAKSVVFANQVDVKHIYMCQSYEQITDQSRKDIDWRREVFVETQYFRDAIHTASTCGILIITGPPGSGKSTLARAVLRHYARHQHEPLILQHFEEWRSHVGGKGLRQIVLLEHVFGGHDVDRGSVRKWGRVMNAIKTFGTTGQCLTLLTLSVQIVEKIMVEENLFRNLPLLDLGSCPALSDSEKTEMIRKHLAFGDGETVPHDDIQEIIALDKSGCVFPWCCARYAELALNVRSGATQSFVRPCLAYVPFIKDFAHFLDKKKKVVEKLLHTMHKLKELEENYGEGPLRRAPISLLKDLTDSDTGEFIYYNAAQFSCRVMYDALGVTVGRYFSLPDLLDVCDTRFLVEYVHTEDVTSHWSVCVKRGSKDWESLLDRIVRDLTSGQLQQLCQHPSLQSLQFLSDMEEFCIQSGVTVKSVASSLDTTHKLPLAYWSMWNAGSELTQWCLSHVIKAGSDSRAPPVGLVEVLFAATLFGQDPMMERAIRNLTMSIPQVVTLFRKVRNHCHGIKLPLVDPENRITPDVKVKCERYASPTLCYLGDPAYPVPVTLVSSQLLGGTLWLVSYCRNLYLTHRLLADREVDEMDDTGNTLLQHAVTSGDGYLASYLTGYGAEYYSLHQAESTSGPGQDGDAGNTPSADNKETWRRFHTACRTGDVRCVKRLSEHNVHIVRGMLHGMTPLHVASAHGQNDVTEILLQRGADVNALTSLEWTPLHLASENGHVRVANILLALGAHVNVQEKRGWSPLHLASCRGHARMADVLLQRGARVDMRKAFEWTPLHLASFYGRSETARVLLQHGATVDAEMASGATPLYLANRHGHLNTTNVLLQHRARPDPQRMTSEGGALYVASRYGHVVGVFALLQHGASVNAQQREGFTPLHAASANGHCDVVDILLRFKADVSIKSNNGSTPVSLAKANLHNDVIAILKRKQPATCLIS